MCKAGCYNKTINQEKEYQTMRLGIMGAGTVGESLARAVGKVGYEVMLSSREPESERMQALIESMHDKAQAGTVQETLAFGDVIALALPYEGALDVARTAGDWSGKVVLDMTQGDMVQLQEITGASVVKIFNTIGAEHYQDPVFKGQNAAMFYCGDDPQAKQIAARIAAQINFAAIDAGDASRAQHLINLARFWVTLSHDFGRDFAFALLKK
ncbi:MAG: NADPH-dependent F420 reductase [Anaerolineae bacterium]